jgi:hypothetical protein
MLTAKASRLSFKRGRFSSRRAMRGRVPTGVEDACF